MGPDPYPDFEPVERPSDLPSTAQALDYSGHDVYVLWTGEEEGSILPPPADVVDFDPDPDGPDPDVWPIEEYDPGAPAPVDELIGIVHPNPRPSVGWYTEEWYEEKYGDNPYEKARENRDNGEWKYCHQPYPAGSSPRRLLPRNEFDPMRLTDDRIEAIRRICRLWNGERVKNKHLLSDKLPNWDDLFGDLDQDELDRLFVGNRAHPDLLSAFGDYEWYDVTDQFCEPRWLLRKKVWYAPTLRFKTLVTEHTEFPDLHGDPRELLTHRVTVGYAAAYWDGKGGEVYTYHRRGADSIDLVVEDVPEKPHGTHHVVGEVITGHNNTAHNRDTFRKLYDHSQTTDTNAWVAFDSRATAYDVLSYWHNDCVSALPNGPITSDPRTDWARNQVREAYRTHDNWPIADFVTLDWLHRNTRGPDGPDVYKSDFHSLTW